MTGRTAFGVLWAAAAIFAATRWWRERPEPAPGPGGSAGATPGRFGIGAEDRSARRLQAMRLAYATGSAAVAGGLLTESLPLLGAGVVFLNLGTAFRYLVVALDHATLEDPLRGLLGDVADRLADQPTAS